MSKGQRVVQAAVIGAGKISEEHLRFLSESPRAKLVGVCDRSRALAEVAAARFGTSGSFTDLEELLAERSPDIVHVLTPPATHLPLASKALSAGAHVIVEKPAAPTLGEVRSLLEAARASGRSLTEDHNYRFNAPVRRILELVAEGILGEVREVDVRLALDLYAAGNRYGDENLPSPSHSLPAGVVHEFVTHLAYLALAFLPEVERVEAIWSNHGGTGFFKVDDLDALVMAGPCHARLRFSSLTKPDGFVLTVRGTRGAAEVDLFRPALLCQLPRKGGRFLGPVVDQVKRGRALAWGGVRGFMDKLAGKTPYEGLERFLDETYAALQQEQELPVSLDDIERTARLVDGLVSSLEP